MSERHLSNTPAAIRARERRFNARVDKEEAKMHAEVKGLMEATGLSFDDAWRAAGGFIFSDEDLLLSRLAAPVSRDEGERP